MILGVEKGDVLYVEMCEEYVLIIYYVCKLWVFGYYIGYVLGYYMGYVYGIILGM